MAGGKGTHATQNRVAMYAAVEAALVAACTVKPGQLTEIRYDFLVELRNRDHVVGHVTDRHHELQARCAELLVKLDARSRLNCVGCGAVPGRGLHTDGCPVEAIRSIVANPLRGDK